MEVDGFEITIQWFAGFFDGEGCINISPSTKSCFSARLMVVNTHLPTLLAIQKVFGGNLQNRQRVLARHKKSYVLVWHGNKTACDMLEKLQPFLVTKRDQADFILNVWKPIVQKHGFRTGKARSAEAWQQKSELVAELRSMQCGSRIQ